MKLAVGRREAVAAAIGAAIMLPFLAPVLRHGAYADRLLLAHCVGTLAFAALTFSLCARVTGWVARPASRRVIEALGILGFAWIVAQTFEFTLLLP